jgi:hypothetical protein
MGLSAVRGGVLLLVVVSSLYVFGSSSFDLFVFKIFCFQLNLVYIGSALIGIAGAILLARYFVLIHW